MNASTDNANSNRFSTPEAGQEQLMADLRTVMADAEALLQATVDQGDEKMEAARAKARESLRLVGARMAQTQDSLLLRGQEAIKATRIYVHEKPWSAVAIAGGVGLLAGLILRRS